MLELAWEGLQAALGSIGQIALIVVPLLIVLEVFKDLGWLNRVAAFVEPAVRPFGLTGNAAPAVVAGVGIGLIYGAGVLYQTRQEGQVGPNEMTILCLFLGLNHAILEDAAVFAALGAPFGLLVLVRLIPAILLTLFLAWWHRWRAQPERGPETGTG